MSEILNIGSRRELFVDRLLVESLAGVAFRLHTPQPAGPAIVRFSGSGYMTVLKDGDLYRAYYRQFDPSDQGGSQDGSTREMTCCAESPDSIEWQFPHYGLYEANGSTRNNVVLRIPPFSHNFAPFVDANPAADPATRYKALAGLDDNGRGGLHAFGSADGVHWRLLHPQPVFQYPSFAFDSQNVSFWSQAEGRYVCYFRSWVTPHGQLRTIARTTSSDFLNWTASAPMNPNLPGEHLYTSQTHPYFRAPHLYVALPTRFQPHRGSSTDILFMTSRAGASHYDRLFTEALLSPGPDPKRWGNRANYAACGVVPTGPAEMSIYHSGSGQRYTLRTDGFVSLRAGHAEGTMTTRPFVFRGEELTLNIATSAGGSARVELRDEAGKPLPGHSLAEVDPIIGDALDYRVTWGGDGDVSAWAGRPVRLHVALREADLYSLAFGPSYYGPAAAALKPYFQALRPAAGELVYGDGASRLDRLYSPELVEKLGPAVQAAQAAAQGQAPYEQRLGPIVGGYAIARHCRRVLARLPSLPPDEAVHCLDEMPPQVLQFDPDKVFGKGPGLYPPSPFRWEAFVNECIGQVKPIAEAFEDARIVQVCDRQWQFQRDPQDAGLAAGWMDAAFDSSRWAVLNADRCWQEQGHGDYHGVAWYRRRIDLPAVAGDRRLILFFGAVDGDAVVFLNGRRIGEHRLEPDGTGWDRPFHFDITGQAPTGGSILVAVRVRKEQFASGIAGGVKLLDVRGPRRGAAGGVC